MIDRGVTEKRGIVSRGEFVRCDRNHKLLKVGQKVWDYTPFAQQELRLKAGAVVSVGDEVSLCQYFVPGDNKEKVCSVENFMLEIFEDVEVESES